MVKQLAWFTKSILLLNSQILETQLILTKRAGVDALKTSVDVPVSSGLNPRCCVQSSGCICWKWTGLNWSDHWSSNRATWWIYHHGCLIHGHMINIRGWLWEHMRHSYCTPIECRFMLLIQAMATIFRSLGRFLITKQDPWDTIH